MVGAEVWSRAGGGRVEFSGRALVMRPCGADAADGMGIAGFDVKAHGGGIYRERHSPVFHEAISSSQHIR
jgi:hypothetical protein